MVSHTHIILVIHNSEFTAAISVYSCFIISELFQEITSSVHYNTFLN